MILAYAGIISLSGCGNKSSQRPVDEDLIKEETMVRLLADIEITEAALKVLQGKISTDSVQMIARKSYDSIFLHYNVTADQFRQNLRYYQENHDGYKEMLEEKTTIITLKKDSITNTPEKFEIKK
jgi:hypothetical protein